MNDPVSFGLAVVALLAVPGPTNTLLFTAGATVGLKRAAHLLLAEVLAYNLAILTLLVLFRHLFASYGLPEMVFRIVAAAYLLVVATRLWKYRWRVDHAPIAWPSVFMTTLMNPKAVVFAFLIFPVNSQTPAREFAEFSLLTVLAGASWMTLGKVIGATISPSVRSAIPRFSSGVLMGFAVVLLASLASKHA